MSNKMVKKSRPFISVFIIQFQSDLYMSNIWHAQKRKSKNAFSQVPLKLAVSATILYWVIRKVRAAKDLNLINLMKLKI